MNSKFFSIAKKTTVIMIVILILCSYSAVHAFSFGSIGGYGNSQSTTSGIFNGFFNIKKYSLEDFKNDLGNMKSSGNIDLNTISDLINKLPSGEDKNILSGMTQLFEKLKNLGKGESDTSIVDKLMEAVTSLLGGGSSSKLPVEPTSIYMDAKTAGEFAGQDYAVKLHANVYMHVDANGNPDSDKWALLIHPFMLKGETIANKVGPFYYEKGYNIIAPDLRSFGESEGEVAMGCLESMDMYDWLTLLNSNYNVSKVIVHGVSLGGATTNFLSGIDQFINNGPTKINTEIKPLRELKVVGLVEDCGYTNMTQFANKSMLLGMNMGLTEENFDYYSGAVNSLKYCDLPMLIIHGTGDFIVKPENAETVKNTVKGEVEYWSINGGVHAAIIVGSNTEEYKTHVQSFIDKCEGSVTDLPDEPDQSVQPDQNQQPEEETSFIRRLINVLKNLIRR